MYSKFHQFEISFVPADGLVPIPAWISADEAILNSSICWSIAYLVTVILEFHQQFS